MSAVPKFAESPRSPHPRRRVSRRRQRSARHPQFHGLGWEMTGRLAVNLALSVVALSTLARLVPYYQSQRQALQEVDTAIATTTNHTQQLQAEFSRYFDPAQASHMVNASGIRESKYHIPIVWVDPTLKQTPQAETQPSE